MPLLRYFVVTGSALLGLMFLADAYLPPVQERPTKDVDRTIIRITSAKTWPGTSIPDSSVFASARR